MSLAPIPFGKFLAGWVPLAAVSAAVDPAPRLADLFAVDIGGGVQLPLVTCGLGLVGVLAGRPLARRQESALSWPLFALVSAILVVTIELWIIESRPGALFSFVVAIGLGFSGYSLIEMVGAELRAVFRGIVTRAGAAIGGKAPSSDSGAGNAGDGSNG